jgi:membrane protein
MQEAEISLLARALAFSTILSIVPFMALAFVFLQKLGGLDGLSHQFETFILDFFRATTGADISRVLEKILLRISKASWTIGSAVALLYTSGKVFMDMELAVNRIWIAKDRRPFIRRIALVVGFYLLVPVALAAYASLRSSEDFREIFAWAPLAWDAILAFIMLLMVNKYVPTIQVAWPTATAGAISSSLGLFVLEASFAWITKKVFNYSMVYGSLAALPLLCLWILIAWRIVLFGVALAAGLQNPAARRRI